MRRFTRRVAPLVRVAGRFTREAVPLRVPAGGPRRQQPQIVSSTTTGVLVGLLPRGKGLARVRSEAVRGSDLGSEAFPGVPEPQEQDEVHEGSPIGDGDAAQEAVGLERGPGVLRPTTRAEPAVPEGIVGCWAALEARRVACPAALRARLALRNDAHGHPHQDAARDERVREERRHVEGPGDGVEDEEG
eukprot:3348720-Alexandrium_andersonii.AAC.1